MTSELVERVQQVDPEAIDALATAASDHQYAIAQRILRIPSSTPATTAARRPVTP